MQNKQSSYIKKVWKFCAENLLFILIELLAFLRRSNAKKKNQFKRNYQHITKMDLLNNDNGNINKVNVLISLGCNLGL